MKRYAFIDVQNTASTTERMLGFFIDWIKLCAYLNERWGFEKIYFYSGIEVGDIATADEFASLAGDHNCVIRSKTTMVYKNQDKKVVLRCAKCQEQTVKVIDMGYRKKSNCDVELSVDAIELAGPDTEFFIFTADGDFEYLIQRAIAKGATVRIVSHPQKYVDKAGQTRSRFATKLRDLARNNPHKVIIMDIQRWRSKIEKIIPSAY